MKDKMKDLSPIYANIYNKGERLIPGVTHDISELIRHRSTYIFFRKMIELDIESEKCIKPIRIVDLGCGVGHGCYTLSEIPNSQIVGVDISPESLEYAERYYSRPNISYQLVNLSDYISKLPEFDYVVSRHVFEHIPNGLEVALSIKCRNRILFEVPYNEPDGNPHHILLGIHEEDFSAFPSAELYFQSLDGIIYDLPNKPLNPNGIICVYGRPDRKKISETSMTFPLQGWLPEDKEFRQLIQHHKELLQKHKNLQHEHQSLQHDYQSLQQSRAVVFAQKLSKYPRLMRLASAGFDSLAWIWRLLRGA